jgi:hypothetical protein
VVKGDYINAIVLSKSTIPITVHLDRAADASVSSRGTTNNNNIGPARNPHRVPEGRWRDRCCCLCCCWGGSSCSTCFRVSCLAYACLPLALGQVMTRMRVSMVGGRRIRSAPSSSSLYWSPFKILAVISVIFIVLNHVVVTTLGPFYAVEEARAFGDVFDRKTFTLVDDAPTWAVVICHLRYYSLVFYGFAILYLTCRTRGYVRETYRIPEGPCSLVPGCEDLCCSYLFPCCTVAQMLRHTADYDTYNAVCCSDTGLGARAPPTLPVHVV